MNKKQLVPDKPGWWWMWCDNHGRWEPIVLGKTELWAYEHLFTWGGPVVPPKWTPKANKVPR
jgi:hypothetical protein